MATDKKPLSKQQKPPRQETGVLTERVELSNPEPERQEQNQAEQQTLLPHERDQTTGPASAGEANEDEHSRAVIGQAAEDTEHGLKDTDRRGIPSDIVASDVPAPSVPAAKRKKGSKAT
ncbi:hypothetical protein [Nitrosovibrio sp. Nv4]|uniref:hypothetical protein n=1 Tax=Nitrosovibrio sp. Nv4 TaxID=1945880 RepID=UPI000BD03243|nr:hypothetical protein [Nitrosovibrio sp. Nv4]SOD41784.1 hypothetical protein SAMN06298226_2087 [Nitrosovibrio sp. Nv4]